MKKAEMIIGVVALTAVILRFLLIPGSRLLATMALLVLSLIYFLFGFALLNNIPMRNIFKRESYRGISSKKIVGTIGLSFCFSIIIIGIIFKLEAWDGSGALFIFGLFFTLIILIIALINYRKNKSGFYKNIFPRTIVIGSLGLVIWLIPRDFVMGMLVENEPEILFEKSFDKSKINKLIIGQWKGASISVQCSESNLLTEKLNNPMIKSMLEGSTQSSLFEFTSDKILIVGESDTNKYSISGDSLSFIVKNNSFWNDDTSNKETVEKFKVVYMNDDSLVLRHSKNTSDPEMALWFGSMSNADEVKDKTIIYTTFYSKVKEANAPWSLIENNLSKQKAAVNLTSYQNSLLCILKSPAFNPNDYDSIFVSNDEAKSWHSLNNAVPIKQFENLSLLSQNERLFALTTSKLFYTENIKQPFTEATNIILEGAMRPTSFAFDKNNFLISNSNKLYLSNDNGINWKQLKTNSQAQSSEINAVAIKGSFIIVGGNTNDNGLLLTFSKDNGESWSNTEESFKDYMGIMPTSLLFFGNAIYMDTQYEWFISKDNGKSWNKISINMPSGKMTIGLGANSITDLSITQTETHVFISSSAGVFLSSDNGSSWVEVNNPELRKGVNSIAIVNSNIFALTPENKIWKASISELVGYGNK